MPALASLAKLIVKSDSVCPVSGSQGSRLRGSPPRLSASRLVGVRREEVLYRSASALSRTFFEVPFQPSAGRLRLPFRCALASGRGCILRGCRPLGNPLMRFCSCLHILYTICGISFYICWCFFACILYVVFCLVVLPYSIPYLLLIRFNLRRQGAYNAARNTTVATPWVTSNGRAVAYTSRIPARPLACAW